MKYLGNLTEDQTIYFRFSTHEADGTPITLAGSAVVSVYKDDDDTQSVAGVVLSVDDDSVTGMHTVKIDTSADAFYAVGHDYSAVITTGTVDSVSVVGTVLATFSIENRFMEADLAKILGTAPTQTGAGYLAGAFTKFFDKQTPTGTINSLPDVVPDGAGGLPTTTKVTDARLGALTDWIDGGRLDLLLDGVKTKTDGLNFTGTDVKATLDGEEVTTDSASQTASKATGFATPTNVTDAQAEIIKYLDADVTIDTTTTPWEMVVLEKGTATELFRKALTQSDDTDVTSALHLVANQVEPEE